MAVDLLQSATGKLDLADGQESLAAPDAQDAKLKEASEPIVETDAEPVTISGRTFPNRAGVSAYLATLQESLVDNQPLSDLDALFMFHLASFLPSFEDALTAPVVGFKYLKGFFMLRSDGTEENISVEQCVDAMTPKESIITAKKGAKRARDFEVVADAPDAKKQDAKLKIRSGCILQVDGIPKNLTYVVVRTSLQAMGDCRFVELKGENKVKKGKGKKGKVEESDSEDDAIKSEFATARARFGDGEAAANAAKTLKEIEGHPVKTRILEGDEEREFWEQLLERNDKKKGKDKDKDKGKGKGKDK